MEEILLNEKLHEIDHIIRSQYKHVSDVGVLTGLSGLSIFQFYYSKYCDTDANAKIGMDIIELASKKINAGYTFPTFCTGIAGMGWVLDHLQNADFIEIKNENPLADLDSYLFKMMVSYMEKGNYDFLHGGIGLAHYFLGRYKLTKVTKLKESYKNMLSEFVSLLKELSSSGNGHLKWSSVVKRDTGEIGYNLSLSHGMASAIGILTKLHITDDFGKEVEKMLKGAIGYLVSFQNSEADAFCLFPKWVPKSGGLEYDSRLAWCYGDLGVGLSIWKASKALGDAQLSHRALEIFKHAIKRKSPEESYVIDTCLCHGAFGNAQIFNRMFKETKLDIFKEAAGYWIQQGLDKSVHKDGYAGFKEWDTLNNTWKTEISLLEGVAGIGLTIIDHLADFETNWDECLMIS